MIAWLLKRPYTIAALLLLVCLLGVGSAVRMSTDIFPEINIPVVSVVWTYSGMTPTEIQNRILTMHERQMPSLVDNIERLEANSYQGVGVIKVYLHEGADVSRAVSQVASSALVVLKYMPRNITPPLVLRYGATDVPIIQLSLSSNSLTDTRLNDLGQNVIRPDLSVVKGASIPYPYGGKPRVIMVDLDPQAMQAQGLSPADISGALMTQNVILPEGDVRIGSKDYPVTMNNSPEVISQMNDFPVKIINGKQVFLRDVAHVHDGYQIQTNLVSQNGRPGALIVVRKTGGESTLAVVQGVKDFIPELKKMLPKDVQIKPLFDQSVFVRASLNGVLREGAIAAGLTAMMILLFLGNWRLTLIVMLSIPTSILCALTVMYFTGDTLNTMTLGGFALAVGILVDDTTVGIENMDRYLEMRRPLTEAIIRGNNEILFPTLLSTLSICIVFVPVFLLTGTAKYLFAPLAEAVVLSMLASFLVARFVVPVVFQFLMRSQVHPHISHENDATPRLQGWRERLFQPFVAIHRGFDHAFRRFTEFYRNIVAWAVGAPLITAGFFGLLMVGSLALFPILGRDFFPSVDAGQMRLHVRCPNGTRLEDSQKYFTQIEGAIRQIVGKDQIDTLLDNIGLPYSGINLAVGDSTTVGVMDGEILIALKEGHSPTAGHMADLRRELPRRFPGCTFFFQAADIVNQVLNFGQPSPVDIRVVGSDQSKTYALAKQLAKDIGQISGVVDSHIYQVPDVPSLRVDVNRTVAQQVGLTQEAAAQSLLVSLNSSVQIAPTFWVNPGTGISYPLVAQVPTYMINSLDELRTMPLAAPGRTQGELLMNIADIKRTQAPAMISQFNVRPVFDVNANVQGRDLYSVARAIQRVMDKDRPPSAEPITVTLKGQVETMERSYSGLFSGMGLAVIVVFLLMVINFQSWLSPFIVLLAVPFGLSGVMWALFLTHTYMSVPALMGALMCIGLTTANSILVVVFANERLAEGFTPAEAAVAAGYTRLRPVLMTAGAMIIGMLPMALGLGEGGEQNAPLGRAVIGGLSFATFATLIFVPAMYELLNRRSARRRAEEQSAGGDGRDATSQAHETPGSHPEYSA